MKTSTSKNNLTILLGLAAALLAAAVLTGLSQTLGVSDRLAFIALVVVGMAMCTTGMKLDRYGWTNPFNLFGIVAGAAALALVGAALLNIHLPFIAGDREAVAALTAIMVVKVIAAGVRNLAARQRRPEPGVQ
jgi:hypothetical protein